MTPPALIWESPKWFWIPKFLAGQASWPALWVVVFFWGGGRVLNVFWIFSRKWYCHYSWGGWRCFFSFCDVTPVFLSKSQIGSHCRFVEFLASSLARKVQMGDWYSLQGVDFGWDWVPIVSVNSRRIPTSTHHWWLWGVSWTLSGKEASRRCVQTDCIFFLRNVFDLSPLPLWHIK